MTNIKFQKEIVQFIPSVRLGKIMFNVKVSPSDDKITEISNAVIHDIRSKLSIEEISQKPTIEATKQAYRKLGKDPSRYRPSAEALTRRIVSGKNLYQINNVVDILNLISLESGFSIGGYDADKIVGDVEYGIGRTDEPFEAIGRGSLNIASLPIFRDSLGAFGSPTSDSVRTMITDKTTRFLMIVIDFYSQEEFEQTLKRSVELYENFTNASEIEAEIVTPNR